MKKRPLWTTALMACLACGRAMADEASRRMYELEFSNWELADYYLTIWRDRFWGYPWVIRTAMTVLITCLVLSVILAVMLLCQRLFYFFVKRYYNRIKKKHYEKLLEVCATSEPLSLAEVEERTGYKMKKRQRNWKTRTIGHIFVEAVSELDEKVVTHNVNVAAQVFGLTAYLEKCLASGHATNRVRQLQSAIFLHIPIPGSVLMRLLYDRDRNLRRGVRMYYLGNSDLDPFSFIDHYVETDFCPWYNFELHYQLSERKKTGKLLPPLLPIIHTLHDGNLKACLIRELAYWGSDEEVESVFGFFTDPDMKLREAAIACVGMRRFTKAEESMERTWSDQPEAMRRFLIQTITFMDSGRAAPFIAGAYDRTPSLLTKSCILRCLWRYGTNGRTEFHRLKRTADGDELLLFEQMETDTEPAGINSPVQALSFNQ